jgi:rare lipoprotein A
MKKKISLFILLFASIVYLFADNTASFGVASYYGTYFHGKKTASGELYDQYKLTAAHKTLPLGTIIKVTNTQNSKSVILKVNDRGPYVKGRIVDVSTKAAELLGFRHKGTTHVKVEIMSDIEKKNKEALIAEYKNLDTDPSELADKNIVKNKLSWEDIPTIEDEKQEDNSNKNEQKTIENNTNGILNKNYYDLMSLVDKQNSGLYGIDLGAYYNLEELISLIKKLQSEYNQPIFYEEKENNGTKSMKLIIGKFQNRAYADAFKIKLNKDFNNCEVVKY